MAEEQITLVTSENERVTADPRMRNVSGLINNILEDSSTSEEIPLEHIKSATLA